MTLLQRARAYADMYRIRRQRHTPPLDTQLREMRRLNEPGATSDPQEALERIANVMHGHPDALRVGVVHDGPHSYAIAYNHGGNLLARVDVDPDGTLTLIPDERKRNA